MDCFLSILFCFSLILAPSRAQSAAGIPEGRFPSASPRVPCRFAFEGRSPRNAAPFVVARVDCEGELLYDEELPLTELDETLLDHGIKLFAETSFGWAFVYLDGESTVDVLDSTFLSLPSVDDRSVTAPLVLEDVAMDVEDTVFEGNQGDFRSGAVVIGGSSGVEFFNVSFVDNFGQDGTVHKMGEGTSELDRCYFRGNNGTTVGAVQVSDTAALLIAESVFESNFGSEMANEIYLTDQAIGFFDELLILGADTRADFEAFLLDPDRPEQDAEDFALPFAAIAAVDGQATCLLIESTISGHVGRFGAIYATDAPVVTVQRTVFDGNRAVTGGGLFANVDRAGFARVLDCEFSNNLARQGGGIVFAGNGTYTISDCTFENNTAVNGGAIWGDYSESNRCPRTSAGSRITIEESRFLRNRAERNGGAFFIQCTDIFAEDSVFEGNAAADGDGGMIWAANTFDVRFRNCILSQNTASGRGGAIFVDGLNEIVSDNSTWTDHAAGGRGGTIVALNGGGVVFRDSILQNSTSGADGGGVFGANLSTIHFRRSSVAECAAVGKGGVVSGNEIGQFHWRSVETDGNAASESGAVFIDGGDSFEVRDMQFRGHIAQEGDAGAIEVRNVANVSIEDVDFIGNTADAACGALSISNATRVVLQNLTLESNTADRGGGLCVVGTDIANLTFLRFAQNEASNGDGGALYMRETQSVSLSDVNFTENRAHLSGGSVFSETSAEIEVVNSVVRASTAEGGNGGGLHLGNTESVILSGVEVSGNEASQSGGGLYTTASTEVRLRDSVLEENLAHEVSGGAIFAEGKAAFTMTGLTLSNNAAGKSGGVLHVVGAESLDVDSTDVTQNRANDGSGGAFAVLNIQSLSLRSVIISNNSARDDGGAVYAEIASEVMLADSLMETNRAEIGDGGALFLEGNANLTVSNLTLFGNEAGRTGGSVALTGLEATSIRGMNIHNSSSDVSGGCLSAHNVGWMRIRDGRFVHCTSSHGGAAIFTGTSNINGQSLVFENNTAREGGGAFLCREETEIDFADGRFFHNAAPDGSTLIADCGCSVAIVDSSFHRDDDRSNNGDFFEFEERCSQLVSLRNAFFGAPDDDDGLKWYEWLGVAAGAVAALLCVLFCCYCWAGRRHKGTGKPAASADIENPSSEKDEDEESGEDSESSEYESTGEE